MAKNTKASLLYLYFRRYTLGKKFTTRRYRNYLDTENEYDGGDDDSDDEELLEDEPEESDDEVESEDIDSDEDDEDEDSGEYI